MRDSPERHLLPEQIGKTSRHGNRLSDHCRHSRSRHSHSEYPDKKIVQNNVGQKARHHRQHGADRTAVVPDQRNGSGAEDLEQTAQNDIAQILLPQVKNLPLRAKQTQNRLPHQVQKHRTENGCQKQKHHAAFHIIFRQLFLSPGPSYGIHDGAAHADPCSQALDQSSYWIGDIDGGQPDIPHAVSHKKAVHDRIDPGQGAGEHRRRHISGECFQLLHDCTSSTANFPSTPSAAASSPSSVSPSRIK